MQRGEEGRGVATAARRSRARSVLRVACCCLTAAVLDGRGARRARRVKLLGREARRRGPSPESEVR